ncbi:hypothetical protein LRAMOSA02201 [Lichtheimia ramosa]|uniref:FAD/NAD(P)-binding domain-containing protein n=1 Tax=Lichtheimia ramosa TaxID=688394 RepID=A0A077WM82_9FUNG|nr:hypothetical protein LRAMOSA02201 [Lichtheimia ramosa]
MVAANPTPKRNVVSIGASSAAMGFSLSWRENPPSTHRLILIEVKTHYNWVYAFPRASVKSGFEKELFIPYAGLFGYKDDVGKVVTARVTAIHKNHVELDRHVPEFGTRIEFDYLLYGAGTTIPQPGRLLPETKAEGISTLKQYQKVIRESKQPIIIGGGAVGLELAAEIKEEYPDKHVTLIHSRSRYMARYKQSLDTFTYGILKKLGVRQVMGQRVNLPEGGFPLEVKPVEVTTTTGKKIQGDLAILCIGMTPNSELLGKLSPKSVNKQTKFVKVKSTMQIDDDEYPHIFAAGDVIEHTDVKTGHFAWMQGLTALANILKLINGGSYDDLEPYVSKDVALIKIALGEKEAVMQTNAWGPLLAVGSWLAARNIPKTLYADIAWSWMDIPCDEEHVDL